MNYSILRTILGIEPKLRGLTSQINVSNLDFIGQPRGIPEDFKARNEIYLGIESINLGYPKKNTEWINCVHYNQQHTYEALKELGVQLHETTRMALQNHQAFDWPLA